MQRRLAAFARGCDVSLGLEQHLGHFDVTLFRGQVQRGVAALVFAVHIDPRGQMRFHRVNQAALCRRENGTGSLDLLAGLASFLAQQRGDLLIFAGEIQRRLALALRVHVRAFLDE